MRFFKTAATAVILLLFFTIAPTAHAVNGKFLENTLVSPHMEVELEDGWNIVFCSTFQIAWSEMMDAIIGDKIRLEKELDLVTILNNESVTKAGISDDDYVAMAGFGSDDIVGKINLAMRTKFGDNAPVVEDRYNSSDAILAYAFLQKELRFDTPFEDFKNPITFYRPAKEARVEAFGIFDYSEEHHGDMGKQVKVMHYLHQREFIVRLACDHPDDEIVLALVEPKRTLLETFQLVESLIEIGTAEPIGEKDILQIPKLDLSIDHAYQSIKGLFLRNEGYEDYWVEEAKQHIRLKLDESGATVESEGLFALKKGPPGDFKILLFDRPFMLYLKKHGSRYPYLAIWIGNEELLIEGM